MKTIKRLSIIFLAAIALSSCFVDPLIEGNTYIEEDTYIESPSFSSSTFIHDYEIWYIDIERTKGNGQIPFLEKAFTVSFRQGTFYANNNLVGMGSNGQGFGLDVGAYDAFGAEIIIDHDIDGTYRLAVEQFADNGIRLFDPLSQTSYFLFGYQRNTFDYDRVFYDNIHYFLQEYETWEKTYTSNFGALNEFDYEQYLKFFYHGVGDNFMSSEDHNGTAIPNIIYDYQGNYQISDAPNDLYRKILTLDYEYLGNDFFVLSVIDERTIELLHPPSGTIYEFTGRGYITFKSADDDRPTQNQKKRLKKKDFLKLKKVI